MESLVQPSPSQGSTIPPLSLLFFERLVSLQSHSPLVGFVGAGDNTFLGVLHEFAEEDKGKELVLGGFRSPPSITA